MNLNSELPLKKYGKYGISDIISTWVRSKSAVSYSGFSLESRLFDFLDIILNIELLPDSRRALSSTSDSESELVEKPSEKMLAVDFFLI